MHVINLSFGYYNNIYILSVTYLRMGWVCTCKGEFTKRRRNDSNSNDNSGFQVLAPSQICPALHACFLSYVSKSWEVSFILFFIDEKTVIWTVCPKSRRKCNTSNKFQSRDASKPRSIDDSGAPNLDHYTTRPSRVDVCSLSKEASIRIL